MNAAPRPVCARLTPPGEGGIHTIGVFGAGAMRVVMPMFRHQRRRRLHVLDPGKLYYGTLRQGGETLDEVILAVPDPQYSATGEEAVEIHCHGGIAASRAVLDALRELGIAPIDAPALAARALETGRLDAIRAEAWLALPHARTRRALDLLGLAYSGELLRQIATAFNASPPQRAAGIGRLLDAAPYGMGLTQPRRAALVGVPNAGKSSLMNRLVAFERSIVSPVAGTTVDRLAHVANFDGIPVELADTGGVMTAAETGADPIHRQAAEEALRAASEADLVVFIVDGSAADLAPQRRLARRLLYRMGSGHRMLVIRNKADLPMPHKALPAELAPALSVSAQTGQGLDDMQRAMVQALFPAIPPPGTPAPFTARQEELLRQALACCDGGDDVALRRLLERLERGGRSKDDPCA